ncbi:hypothetical protein MHYP_G00131660 [Metynnis hypsauchen]
MPGGQHSPLKRSVSLTPPMSGPSNPPLGHGWLSQEDLRGRAAPDHAPLSPQSSIASSGSGGSEHMEDGSGLGAALRSTFHEEGSGMRDVPAWLKSLRLHKYAGLFSSMTYEEMMSLTEQQLEAQNITKGARHKIIISIQKLKERQNMLRSLEKAFTETQKKRLLSWKQQVQKLFRSFPRKTLVDMAGYRQQRSGRGFGQSNSLPSAGCVGSGVSGRRNLRQFPVPSRSLPVQRLGLLGTAGLLGHTHTPRSSSSTPTSLKQGRQGLWFANPGGSNSMPSRTHSSVQRTRSLPVHTNPHTMAMFQQSDLQVPVTEPDINNRLESLCLSMTEHALGDGVDRTSII